MLEIARGRTIYDRLVQADALATGLAEGTYDLATSCLMEEHLRFIMTAGMPTHFDRATGESVAIETYVHLVSDHVTAARAAGLWLLEMRERLVDDSWITLKPGWARFRNHPVSFATAWQKR
jgi:hypothetical protein